MRNKELNVVTLKPTIQLLAFIDANITNVNWSKIACKKCIDNAYILKDVIDEDSLIDALEKIYVYIFRYELKKLVGPKKAKKAQVSFYDFLSCFKFEVHSHKSIISKINEFGQKATFVKLNTFDLELLFKNRAIHLMDICDEIALLNLSFEKEIHIKRFSHIVMLKLFWQQIKNHSLKDWFKDYFHNYNQFDKVIGKSIRIDFNHRVAHR